MDREALCNKEDINYVSTNIYLSAWDEPGTVEINK